MFPNKSRKLVAMNLYKNPFIVNSFLRLNMGSVSKSFPLLLVLILAVSSLIMATPAFAQSVPTPSVPTFTVQPVGPSYTVPTTYSFNQSSGQTVANIGYIIEFPNVEVTIKNQPFTPTLNDNGGETSFYYNIQIKAHNETDNWIDLYSANITNSYPQQSYDSDYTNISIPVVNGQIDEGIAIPVGAQTDIQVEALIGNIYSYLDFRTNPSPIIFSFVGETSGWSNTETVTVPANVPLSPIPAPSSSTSTLTPTPTLTSVSSASYASLLLIALVVIAFLLAIIIFLLIYMRKRKPINSSQQTVSNSGM